MIFNFTSRMRRSHFPLVLAACHVLSLPPSWGGDAPADSPPYVKYFPAGEQAEARAFAEENRKLMDAWVELHEAQLELIRMRTTFGTRKRQQAQRVIPRLEKTIEQGAGNLFRYIDLLQSSYQKERMKIKEQQSQIEEKADRDKSADSSSVKKLQEKSAELGDKIRSYDARIGVLNTMRSLVGEGNKSSLLAQLYRVDQKTLDKYMLQYADVVEAANVVRDYQADIDEVKGLIKEKGDSPQLARSLANLETGLVKAKENLGKLAEQEKKAFGRDIARAESDLEQVEKKIAAQEKRGRETKTEKQEKAEIGKRLEGIQEIFKFLDGIVAGTEPKPEIGEKKAGKKPGKAPDKEKVPEKAPEK